MLITVGQLPSEHSYKGMVPRHGGNLHCVAPTPRVFDSRTGISGTVEFEEDDEEVELLDRRRRRSSSAAEGAGRNRARIDHHTRSTFVFAMTRVCPDLLVSCYSYN